MIRHFRMELLEVIHSSKSNQRNNAKQGSEVSRVVWTLNGHIKNKLKLIRKKLTHAEKGLKIECRIFFEIHKENFHIKKKYFLFLCLHREKHKQTLYIRKLVITLICNMRKTTLLIHSVWSKIKIKPTLAWLFFTKDNFENKMTKAFKRTA